MAGIAILVIHPRLSGVGRSATPMTRSPTVSKLYLGLFGHFECIVNLNPEVAYGAFELRVTEQQLHHPKVLRPPVDQCRLYTPHRVRTVGGFVKADLSRCRR